MNVHDVDIALSLLLLLEVFEALDSVLIKAIMPRLRHQLLNIRDDGAGTCRCDELLALVFLEEVLRQLLDALVLFLFSHVLYLHLFK